MSASNLPLDQSLVSQEFIKAAPLSDGQKYEFFVTTGQDPGQLDGASRTTIRRLVMRNFFEEKNASSCSTKPSSAANSSSTVEAGSKLKGRFRLAKAGQTILPEKSRYVPKRAVRRLSKENKVAEHPKPVRRKSNQCTASDEQGNDRTPRDDDRVCSNSAVAVRASPPLRRNPNAHRHDPFNMLPIPATFKLDLLFSLYVNTFRINSISVNPRNTWWPFISRDATLLHSIFASVALYSDLTHKGVSFRVEALRHKNEAIKGINAKLSSQTEGITDQLVGAVSVLASFENLCGAYDAAQLHVAALKRMVDARGGLSAFRHNDGLARGLIWVDFHSASAFRTRPIFPFIPSDDSTTCFPDELLEEAACSSPTSLLQLSLASIDCFNIFYRLHRLGLATSAQWAALVDRSALANMLYEAEYALLSMPNRSPDFLIPDRHRREGGAAESQEKDETANTAAVIEALVTAGQVFLYAALREVPLRARIFDILLSRLRATVDRPAGVDIVAIWTRERNLQVLLWTLVVGAAVGTQWGGDRWWVVQTAQVVERLEISTREAFKEALKGVAWTDVFFGPMSEGVWEGVVKLVEEQGRDSDGQDSKDGKREVDEVLEENITPMSDVNTVSLPILSKDVESPGARIDFVDNRWKVGNWYV
ncbi:hypothetical protein K432DRAFT_378712 [Lepidopterella palustris CBS 459.81]|uniref:Tachykinin family protein n=1 Tax=Lepidopterella palustris CBS 459.81 TaxID=1314670 RepID=A0A8E2EI79_9PEZI|nr:hypothetical protein K432DRAFT_378712 [Lepidopterella palustris CBS 459.81]